MIIKGKPLGGWLFKLTTSLVGVVLRSRFNKIVIDPIKIKEGHSYLLMCNHFSFLDGLMALYLCRKVFADHDQLKTFQVMVLKGQLKKRKWLKRLGGFSVAPGSRSISESLGHAKEVLSTPGNLLLLYPQGNLESMYVRKIIFQDGINQILPQVEGKCQVVWASVLMEYFESIKPTLYFSMLDCGTNEDFDFDTVANKVNEHHLHCIKKNIRFTNEEI